MSVFERITKEMHSGMVLYTPVERSRFTVDSVEADRIVFSVGSGTLIPVPKTCWD